MGRPAQRAQALRARLEKTLERDRVSAESGNLQLFEAELRRLIERFVPGGGNAARVELSLEGEGLRLQAEVPPPARRGG